MSYSTDNNFRWLNDKINNLVKSHYLLYVSRRHAQTANLARMGPKVGSRRIAPWGRPQQRTAAQRGAAVMTALFRISCAALYCICALAFIDSSGKYVFKPVNPIELATKSAESLGGIKSLTLPDLRFPEFSAQSLNVNIDTSVLESLKVAVSHLNVEEVRSALVDAGVDTQLIENGLGFVFENPLVIAPVLQVGLLAAVVSISQVKSVNDANSYGGDTSYVDKARAQIYATNGRYNPTDAQIFYGARPLQVISRSAEIFAVSAAFGSKLALDLAQDKLFDYDTELKRAEELCDILTNLGPAFIKIGQSLSVRTDLLRPAYVTGLTKLQDRVPPFPTDQALDIIARELGVPSAQAVFTDIMPESSPIAAASLGQVFKAKMRRGAGGEKVDVAVKVQRPGITDNISLDLHIIRSLAPVIKKVAGLESDLIQIVDSLGEGFVDELDYRREAENAGIFMESIADTPLKGVVFAPEVVDEASSQRVLTTLWVEGERLEESPKEEISKLCSIAMNTYLTMMLQSPILHADPHPGNLRRTPDGKLCIMDWGLVTSVSPDLQETYIEHIAHLVSKDYDEVPGDLVKLGFVGEGMEQVAQEQGVVDVLADVYGRWALGGGAAKVDVAGVISQLNGLTATFGNFFRLPPYFAYIARAFGVLEGIGLQANPDYAIVGECLPYIAQRLLTTSAGGDNSRSVAALESFLFGKEKASSNRVIDADRISLLVDGFNSYRAVSTEVATREAAAASMSMPPLPESAVGSAPHREPEEDEDYSIFRPRTDVRSVPVGVPTLSFASAASAGRELGPVHSERVRRVEEAADVVVSLLIDAGSEGESALGADMTDERGPRGQHATLQTLVLEETAKLLGAASRQQWAQLRQRSGRNGDGSRSNLGALVDPLGIFSKGRLVNPDSDDERILESASAIVEAIRASAPASTASSEAAGAGPLAALASELQSLSPTEAVQISSIIADKVWTRRGELLRIGGRFTRVLLQQARQRL